MNNVKLAFFISAEYSSAARDGSLIFQGIVLYKVKHVCGRNMDNAVIMYDLYYMCNIVSDKNAIF